LLTLLTLCKALKQNNLQNDNIVPHS